MPTEAKLRFSPRAEDDDNGDSPVKFEGTQSTIQGVSRLGASHASASSTGVARMMQDLDRIQGEQMMYSRRIEKEHKRKEHYENSVMELKDQLVYYRTATKSGSIVKEDDMIRKKMIGKLEYQVGQARNKLSFSRKENQKLKTSIIETRQEKLMHLSILNEQAKELKNVKKSIHEKKDEVNIVNNRKQRKEVEIANMKQAMFTEIEVFSDELAHAKKSVITTQSNILDSIREKLQATFADDPSEHKHHHVDEAPILVDTTSIEREEKLIHYLKEVKVTSLEELIVTLQKTEESMFTRYNDIQEATQEMEKVDVDNKHLESTLAKEEEELQGLEAASEHLKQELEENINHIHDQITKYDNMYGKNMETLDSCKSQLTHILVNFALDDDPTDQALLATGVTDRNIPEFLGQVEQRIDELIQMLKASKHERIQREDFIRSEKGEMNGDSNARVPVLPSFSDEYDDEEYENVEKVQPINVGLLKDFMTNKVNRGLQISIEDAMVTSAKEQERGVAESKAAGVSVSPIARPNSSSPTSENKKPSRPSTQEGPGLPRTSESAASQNSDNSGGRRKKTILDTRSKEEKRRDIQQNKNNAAADNSEVRLGSPV